MHPFRTSMVALVFCAFCQAAVSQNLQEGISDSKNCPTIAVQCTLAVDCPEKPLEFTAIVRGKSIEQIRYRWEVSDSTILSGQGTATLTVDSRGLGGRTVTAAVEISGLASVCPRKASCSTAVFCEPFRAFLFDRYYPKSSDHSISKNRTRSRRGARSRLVKNK